MNELKGDKSNKISNMTSVPKAYEKYNLTLKRIGFDLEAQTCTAFPRRLENASPKLANLFSSINIKCTSRIEF